MNGEARNYPPGDMRVSDADRDRALSELSAAYQAGRLTKEEYDERSSRALQARAGKELTALFADLPLDDGPVTPAASLDAAPATDLAGRASRGTVARVAAARAAMVGCACAAIPLVAVAVSNALSVGPSLATREAKRLAAEQILAGQGIHMDVPLQPAQGFDYVGTIVPAAFAVLLFAVIVILHMTRADRRHQAQA